MERTEELLDSGWFPPQPADDDVVTGARTRMRLRFWPSGPIRGNPPSVVDGPAVADTGCLTTTEEDDEVRAVVFGPATIELTAPEESVAGVGWRDEFGDVHRDITFAGQFVDGAFVTLARPATTAELVITGSGITVCGVRPG
jgi:hypothetical protein